MKKILIIFVLLFITGCWNYQELNEYAIVTGIAIDDNEGQYEISLLLSNGKKKEEEKAQIKVYSSTGKTINEAMKNISLTMPKKIYLNHLAIIIISDLVAQKGISPVLDYFLREPQTYQNFNVIFSKNTKAKDILSIINPLSDYPSQNINNIIKINEKEQGRITDSKLNYIIDSIISKGKNPVINSIILIGNKEQGTKKEEQDNSLTNSYTKLDTLGIFKDDRLVGWASINESIGINMLKNDLKQLYLDIPCKDNHIIITTNNYKLKNEIKKNRINVFITLNGNISEVGCNVDLNDKSTIEMIESKVTNLLLSYTSDAIDKAKQLETDIFGYGNLIYKKYPRYFNSLDDWNNSFKNLEINVLVNFKLNNKNSLKQTIGALKK